MAEPPSAGALLFEESIHGTRDTVSGDHLARWRRELVPLYTLSASVLCAARGWYLLKELAPLLLPLTLSVFLAYTTLPEPRP